MTPTLGPNFKEIILLKPKGKDFETEIQGITLISIKMKDLNNIPLSRITTNKIEIIVIVKRIYKMNKTGHKIIGDLIILEKEHLLLRLI